MTAQEAIAIIESVRPEHEDGGPDGIMCCDSRIIPQGHTVSPYACDCGADEAIAKVDAVVAWLRAMDEPREGPAARAIRAEIEAWARPAVVTNAEALEQYVRGLRRALELAEQAEARCHDRPPGR